jgi:hypothetical protein
MVSKKVGLQCLNHLIDKFNQYSTDYKLQDKKEKYIYLDCYINLLDKFASSVKIYQKEKIREDELLLFENEINKNIKILEEINGEETNIDIPSKIKNQLVKLIQRAKKNMFYDDRISREFYHDTLDKYLSNSKEIIEHVLTYDTFSIIGIVGDKIHINNNCFNYFKEYTNQRLNVLCKKISTLEEAFAYFN